MRRVNRKGRNNFERFSGLPHKVLNSPGYRRASCTARAVLIQILKRFNGSNNGYIGMSVRDAAEECNIAKDTANRALQELEDCGLIEVVNKGNFRMKNRKASEYRLLWLRCDLTGVQPRAKYLMEQ